MERKDSRMIAMKKLVGLSVLTLFLTTVSGCRFGNYADVAQPIPDPNAAAGTIKTFELFFTQPTALQVAVFYNDTTPTGENDTVPLSAIPADTLSTFSDPLYYAIPVDPSASSMFIGVNGTSFVNTTVDASGNITSPAPDDAQPLRTDPNCLIEVQDDETGVLDRSTPGTYQFSGGPAAVSGHLKMSYTRYNVLFPQTAGACDTDLNYLAQCYLVGTGCSADDLDQAQQLFDLYVKQAGILDLSNVTKIKALAYSIQLE
jgi:hypothetical protein